MANKLFEVNSFIGEKEEIISLRIDELNKASEKLSPHLELNVTSNPSENHTLQTRQAVNDARAA